MLFAATGQFEELVSASLSLVRVFRGVVPHYGISRLNLQDLRKIRELGRIHVQRRSTPGLYQVFPSDDGNPGSRRARIRAGLPQPLDTFLVIAVSARFCVHSSANNRSAHEVAALIGIFSRAERNAGGRQWVRRQRRSLHAMGDDWCAVRLPALLVVAREVARRLRSDDSRRLARSCLEEAVAHREATRYQESEIAFRRAIASGARARDNECVALAKIGLGYALKFQGDAVGAERSFASALKSADQSHLRLCKAYALHGLATLAIEAGDAELANSRARVAFQAYDPGDRHIVALVHDIAFLWLEQGYARRALTVFRACASRLDGVAHMIALSSLARAAAAADALELAEAAWWRAWNQAAQMSACHKTAQTYFNLGVAAQIGRHWNRAQCALEMALRLGEDRGELTLVRKAREAVQGVQARALPTQVAPPDQGEVDDFARVLVTSLRHSAVAGDPRACEVPG